MTSNRNERGTGPQSGSERTRWSSVGLGFALAVGGAGAGAAAKIADERGPRWLGDLGTGLAVWVFIAIVIGWFARSAARSAVFSIAFFVPMTAAYYLWTSLVLHYPMTLANAGWFLVAAVGCPIFSAICGLARRGRVGDVLVAGLGAAVLTAASELPRLCLQVTGQLDPQAPLHTGQALTELLLVVSLLLLPSANGRRLAAVAVLVVAYFPISTLVEALSSRLLPG